MLLVRSRDHPGCPVASTYSKISSGLFLTDPVVKIAALPSIVYTRVYTLYMPLELKRVFFHMSFFYNGSAI
jgi:hypothetical protein